jgi:hypothetical protein
MSKSQKIHSQEAKRIQNNFCYAFYKALSTNTQDVKKELE